MNSQPDLYPVMLFTLAMFAMIGLYPILQWIKDKLRKKK